MIEIRDLGKSYGGNVLFQECSFRLGARDRLGLIGPNGSGKTTLLRMIIGEEHPDRGEIMTRRGVQIGFLSQEPAVGQGQPLIDEVTRGIIHLSILEDKMQLLQEEIAEEKDPEALEGLAKAYGQLEERFARQGGYTLTSQAKAILLGLGFREEDFQRSADEFSGGWQMRIALAKILLANPDLLLLDEPTNHLDLESLIWLEGFLTEYPGSLVIVSHDRDFLNRVVTRIGAIEGKKISLYAGNYDAYTEARERKILLQEAALENQRKKIEQTERFIERFRYKSTKARQVQSRVKALEKVERVDLGETRKTIHFSFPQPARSGKTVVELRGIHKAYGPIRVYSGIELVLLRGDKVALVGPNGAGKSTLLKLLAGLLEPDQGTRTLGHNATTGYFAQHQLELLDPTKTVWEEIFSLAKDEPVSFLRGLLGAFLFSGEDVEKKVSVLSGGEKSRLVLAKMLMRPANFLLLDEPTNHLDLSAREVLEQALLSFQGTLCFITHDRHLINSVANKIIEVNASQLSLYQGNYEDYLYKKERETKDAPVEEDETQSPAPKETRKGKEQKRLEAETRNRLYRETQELRQKIEAIERSLGQAKRDLEAITLQLSDPEVYR
ncbi:MAG: ABC-F family ATP-binding cassette domain-containing protein, partial [Deltaproteobacteria bacterium]|nr:ABC-F family ATP-binding cassette domain-containing protein [Deltaproteobacteria bacterium]